MAQYTIRCEVTVQESASVTVEATTEAEAFKLAAAIYSKGVEGQPPFDFYTDDVTELDFYRENSDGTTGPGATLEEAQEGGPS